MNRNDSLYQEGMPVSDSKFPFALISSQSPSSKDLEGVRRGRPLSVDKIEA